MLEMSLELCWMVGLGSQGHLISCLREYSPPWSQGMRLPCLFRDLNKTSKAKYSLRP